MEKVRVMKCVLSCENQTVRWLHEFLSKAAEVLTGRGLPCQYARS